jgi:predicted phage tail protein
MIGQDVHVVSMLNFLEPFERTVEMVPWTPGMRIEDCMPEHAPLVEGLDLAVSVNGRPLTDFEQACYTVQPGDSLLFKVVPRGGGGGGGKNVIGSIASIAMMVAAPGIAGAMFPFASVSNSFGFNFATMALKAVTGAVALGGSMLVNAVLPSAQPQANTAGLGSNTYDYSATYAWTPQENPTRNGSPAPIVYGTVANSVPFKLCQYIDTDGDSQYLNMLFALGEGPLDESGVTDIEINGNPIENYENVTTEFRPGTADQSVIEYFNDTVYERAIGTKLSTDWTTVQCDGTAVEAMGVGLSCPSGLWYANDQGGLDAVSITVEAEYRAVGAASWTSWTSWTISEAQRSAVRRYNRLDSLDADQYEIRLRFSDEPETGSRYSTDCYFEYLHEINLDDFRLPYTALLAVRALATDQLSGGTPRVTCTLSRPTVDVWDPDAEAWTTEDAGNPAWAAYDLCRHPRYGAGVPVADILYDEFETAADWCDTKGITGGMIFDASQDLKTACDTLGLFGRFSVVPRGTSVGVVSDKPVDLPDQGLVVGDMNMIDFSLSWEDDDRADAAEVTYFDPDKGRDTVLVLGDHYLSITDRQPKHAKLTLYFCQDRTLAIKAGRYMLRCNRYLAEKAEIKMREKAMGLLPGHVVQLAHSLVTGSQPARVVSATTTTITLDREVTLLTGETYSFRVNHSDRQHATTGEELVEKRNIQAVGVDTTTDTITMALALDYAPAADCDCSIDDTTVTTQYYRIKSIRRTSKGRYTLEALEYQEDIYADEGEVPEINLPSSMAKITGLTAGIFDRTEDGVAKRVIALSWRGSSIWWRVWARRLGGGVWTVLGDTSVPQFDCRNLTTGAVYDLAVSATPALNDAETVQVDFSEGITGVIETITVYDENDNLVPVTVTVSGAETVVTGVS